jgi:hypothetical protein
MMTSLMDDTFDHGWGYDKYRAEIVDGSGGWIYFQGNYLERTVGAKNVNTTIGDDTNDGSSSSSSSSLIMNHVLLLGVRTTH